MSRQSCDGGVPHGLGRSPTSTGLVGSVMSTKEVPSLRPTSAYSRSVTGSVQPQLSLARTPRARSPARSSDGGMYASSSTSLQSKGPTWPSSGQRRSSPTSGASMSGSVTSIPMSSQPAPPRSKRWTEPARWCIPGAVTATTDSFAATSPPNWSRSTVISWGSWMRRGSEGSEPSARASYTKAEPSS